MQQENYISLEESYEAISSPLYLRPTKPKYLNSIETYYWTLKLSFDSNDALLVPDSSRLGHPVRLIKDH